MAGDDVAEVAQGVGEWDEERILVSVRVRPLSGKEMSRNEVVDWECVSDTTIVYKNQSSPERSMYPTSYTFDRVFRWDCSTRQVYEEGARTVVLSAVRGINSSVFAYGQTSSGKTFTMYGITEYTMEDIFEYIQKHKEREFQLKFSAMEIYNESVRDLLTEDNSPLRLLDDPERGTVVERLTEETLRDWNHFKELLAVCEAKRQIGETNLNEVSSRSHQILRLTIESSTREYLGKSNSSTLTATLNFVDLAGSERASQALSAGSRLKEGSHINRSLLTLGTVIRKLSKGTTGHIPYRDSKLTRILQSSLGGNARTAVVCTMSPARSYAEQSRNTLLFASCAKEVTTNARVNVVVSDKVLVKHLQRELARLQSELKTANPSDRADAADLLREKESKIEQMERHIAELTLQLNLALSKIQDLQQGGEDRRLITWEGDHDHSSYPKSPVRLATSDSYLSDRTIETDHRSFDGRSTACQTPQSPDRHSTISYEENYSISDFEENLPLTSPFERMFSETPSDALPQNFICPPPRPEAVALDRHQNVKGHGERASPSEVDPYMVIEGNDELSPHSYKSDTFDICLQQVSNGHGAQSPYFVEFDPYQVSDEINSCETDKYHISPGISENCHEYDDTDSLQKEGHEYGYTNSLQKESHDYGNTDLLPKESHEYGNIDSLETHEAIREQADEHLQDDCKEVQCIEYEITNNVQPSSPQPELEENSLASTLTEHENDRCTDEELKHETEMKDIDPSSIEDPSEPSVEQEIDSMRELEDLNCVECGSDRSNSMGSTSSLVVEKVMCEIINECGDEGDASAVSLEDSEGKLSSLKYNAPDDEVSLISEVAELDQTSINDIKVTTHVDSAGNSTCGMDMKEITDSHCMEKLPDHQSEDTVRETSKPRKIMKDVGLNPLDDLDTSAPWPSDFKMLQEEIINLWHACSVPLVHRTRFFLVFIKGDPTDTIYMEVERRRLSCIRDAFSNGSPIVLEGQKLTPSSSRKALLSERKMLGKQMKKRLSRDERRHLFVEWGILLNSKDRCSQLAHRLWADTIDMYHITESANIVAKLVRFSEPQVPKEVFGLNMITTPNRRKSFSLL